MSSTETIEEPASLQDEPDTTEQPQTFAEKKAQRMEMLSPLGQAIEGRSFGHPPRAERPPLWVDQLARPALDYNPKNITELPDYQLHDVAVTEVVAALEAMQSTLNVVIDAREKTKRDPTMHPGAMVLVVADYAETKFPAATRKVDAALAAIEKRITDTEAKLREGIPGHAGGEMAGQIRRHVKELKNGTERMKFMSDRIAEGDVETVAAVVKGKAWLSGLSQAEVDVLVHAYNLKAQPELSPRIDFLKKARDHLVRASAPFIVDCQRAVGVKHETVKRLRDAKAAAKLN